MPGLRRLPRCCPDTGVRMRIRRPRSIRVFDEPVRQIKSPVTMGRRFAPGFGAFMLAALLSGCGSAPLATFDISAPSSGVKARSLRGVLVVNEPTAPAPIDGDRIVVRSAPSAVAVLAGAQWADRLPRLLQTRLIQTFENARLLKSVGRPGDGLTADYSLNWEVRRFEMDIPTGQAVVEVSVKVLTPAGRIAAAQIFTAQIPGSAADGGAATVALDAASNSVLRQIVAWAGTRV
jgi:cholesterol transport system auxiliary component